MKRSNLFMIAVIAFAVCVVPGFSLAQVVEETDVVPEHTITALEQRAIKKAAVNVMKHIIDAREAIQKKDYAAAKQALNSSLRLIKLIRDTSGPVMVHDYIWAAKKHLAMDEVHEVIPDLVPIYSALVDFEAFNDPEEAVRSHIKKAEEHLQKGNKPQALQELELGEEALTAIEAYMPLEYTRKQVTAALDALAQNDPARAAESLKMAEGAVHMTVTSIASPGLLAKTAILKATMAYDAKNFDKADAALQQAKAYLQEAIQNMDVDERYKALDVIKRIDALEGKILKGDDQTGVQLKALWNKARELKEHIAKIKTK
jgi:tetratricopeptide (TPR) repeat protein